MNKSIGYIVWSWTTTLLLGGIIIVIALTEDLSSANATEEVIKVAWRLMIYSLFFLLFYRAVVATLRNTVDRLSDWHSKREAHEDAEFVLIVETLIVIVSILVGTTLAAVDEYIQSTISGRDAALEDVLVSVMAILLTALVVYTIPSIGELEYAIKRKLDKELNKGKSKKKKK